MSTWLCSSGEERALVSGLRESEFWSFAKGLRDRGAARGFRGQPKSTLGLPFTCDKLGQLFQKVENDENQFFAITSSKLVRNWFCKKHLVRNHIFHNYCFIYVLWFSLILKTSWFLCFLLEFAMKNQSKIFIFNISIRVPNIIFDALTCFYL